MSLCWAGTTATKPAFCHVVNMSDKTRPKAYKRLYTFIDAHVYRALNLMSGATDEKSFYLLPIQLANTSFSTNLPDKSETRSSCVSSQLTCFYPAMTQSLALCPTSSSSSLDTQATGLTFDNQHFLWNLTPPNSLPCQFQPLQPSPPFRHVILETLRTHGPAGRVFRKARYDTTLPRGGGPDGNAPVFVPQGTTVYSLTYHIHHDQDIWGQDANIFRPERWGEGYKAASEFVPFLIGPRICPAQQQVLVQATYFLFRIVREFEWIKNRDQVEDIELQRMVIESRRGVMIALGSNFANH